MANEVLLYGVIGEKILASDVKDQLATFDQTQPLTVRIHSEGGSVMDGIALYDAFKAYAGPKKAVIESAAFSIASYIAMAFDEVEITENGYLMIHNPSSDEGGDDEDHAATATVLAKLKDSMVRAYAAKTGKPEAEVVSIMKAETWFNAQEALSSGLVNRINGNKLQPRKMVAWKRNMPQRVVTSLFGEVQDAGEVREPTREKSMSESQKPVAASLAEIKAAFPKAKAEFLVSCLEKSLPMASVMSEALSAMDEELQALRAQLADANAKLSAKAEEPAVVEEVVEEEVAMEEEEEVPAAKAKAKAKGVSPVAKIATPSRKSATAEFESKIQAILATGKPRVAAVRAILVENPELHQRMLEEANAKR